ncbi:unnamed protein product [Strongylus vulgaris]|uniref:Uncharacterized protein n=1 Tax=Strongylus vulgaris TaxID=40348 RepID=A0A3P7JXV0_STRVU|nr:unnamed protein product [Strongylus vulgaris]
MMAIEKTQTEILECLRALMAANIPTSPIPDDRPYVEHSQSILVVSDAGSVAEGLAPLAPVHRRQRMNTVSGTGKSLV